MKSLPILLTVFVSALCVNINAQVIAKAMVIEQDTIIKVGFPAVTIVAEREFYDDYVRDEFYRVKTLNRDVSRVIPFAEEASRILISLDEELLGVEKKKDKKRIIKTREAEIQLKIEARLQTLTRQQGEIMVKLVHKETGQTVHHWLQSIKGKAGAFYLQNIARAGGVNLKLEYNPEEEDKQIEKILGRS